MGTEIQSRVLGKSKVTPGPPLHPPAAAAAVTAAAATILILLKETTKGKAVKKKEWLTDDNLKEEKESDVAAVASLPKTQEGSQVMRGFLETVQHTGPGLPGTCWYWFCSHLGPGPKQVNFPSLYTLTMGPVQICLLMGRACTLYSLSSSREGAPCT